MPCIVRTDEDFIFQLFQKVTVRFLGNDNLQLSHCTEPNDLISLDLRTFKFKTKKVIKRKRRNKVHNKKAIRTE